MSDDTYDVVVVGAGHNGLVAAFYFAKQGLRTLVLERREIVGGACVTEEFLPGFSASPGAYVLSMLRPASVVLAAWLLVVIAVAGAGDAAEAQQPTAAPVDAERLEAQALSLERQLLCPQCTNKRLDVCEIAICHRTGLESPDCAPIPGLGA